MPARKTKAEKPNSKGKKAAPRGLTPKQEKFCQLYIELGNASAAYRNSYSAGKMKPETINRCATELLQNHTITARLDELRAKHAKRHDETVDDILNELDEARVMAKRLELPHVMASASMNKAKLHGFVIEKRENFGKDGGPIQHENVDDMETLRRFMFLMSQTAENATGAVH